VTNYIVLLFFFFFYSCALFIRQLGTKTTYSVSYGKDKPLCTNRRQGKSHPPKSLSYRTNGTPATSNKNPNTNKLTQAKKARPSKTIWRDQQENPCRRLQQNETTLSMGYPGPLEKTPKKTTKAISQGDP